MKSNEIIQRLEDKGYVVKYGKYEYWQDIPYVEHSDGSKTFLAKTFYKFRSVGIEKDIPFNRALEAINRKCIDINDLENQLSSEKIKEEARKMTEKYS